MRRVAPLLVCGSAALMLAGAGQTRSQAATVKVAFLQGEQLVLVTRAGSGVDGVAKALLAGPTAAERTKDTRSAIPEGTPLRSVALTGNVVTVDLGEKFALGTNADSLNARLVQVVLSFTTVPGVKFVRLLVKGGVPLGLFPGFPTSRPLSAKDVQRPTVAPPGTAPQDRPVQRPPRLEPSSSASPISDSSMRPRSTERPESRRRPPSSRSRSGRDLDATGSRGLPR